MPALGSDRRAVTVPRPVQPSAFTALGQSWEQFVQAVNDSFEAMRIGFAQGRVAATEMREREREDAERRARMASFDVDAERARVDHLGEVIRSEARRHGIEVDR